MFYDGLKIVHILSAALLIGGITYCIHLWHKQRLSCSGVVGGLTEFLIAPFALIQLLTGFTLLSMKQENFSQLWVKGSVLFFITALFSWFVFVYLLKKSERKLSWEWFFLFICIGSILSMIFLMANKI